MYHTIYHSPLGEIAITANDDGITALAFQQGAAPIQFAQNSTQSDKQFSEVTQQLTEYFAGQRTQFDLALAPQGTPFQQTVWQALTEIPFGKTVSYGWLAKSINNEKAVRAVGTANGANPIALIIPCHRVIGANKKLTGYAGGLALKAKLLMHEQADFKP
ncbi:methylated-DNA--[protein]-cysteine S-methyltransferase [Thalassotalea euphylliae]|uniref:Methylated-DNA--protein-cysteine methyltransferase n=1 Tax=Thalassotalea euphylliae TaxID=1655234 RepID=A0A3E0UDR7_9GAMM|nr:methylated-DNA--[protein]-cysteine S-methyltransferase [Thalassotalea euphylliae]REL34713.1 methylated-DNA--[protein]-cysteine S-methyltransferase [Thalassotalea euphylliae]